MCLDQNLQIIPPHGERLELQNLEYNNERLKMELNLKMKVLSLLQMINEEKIKRKGEGR